MSSNPLFEFDDTLVVFKAFHLLFKFCDGLSNLWIIHIIFLLIQLYLLFLFQYM